MKVLIAGGSGLVGMALSKLLRERSHEVTILSRSDRSSENGIQYSQWDPMENQVSDELFKTHDAVINLAGFPVNSRWTDKNKQKILQSRLRSTEVLVDGINKEGSSIGIYIQASAIGYYPAGEKLHRVGDPAGSEFLSEVCVAWENASAHLKEDRARKVINRIGVVLAKDGGALKPMLPIFKLGLGSKLGNGQQFMSFIHIDDLVNLILFQMENSIEGTFNAVAPNPVRNEEFSRELAKALKKPYFMPPVPGFALKIFMGESASIALDGQKVSCSEVINSGFQFQYSHITKALFDLLS